MTDPLLALGVVELVDALGAARQTVAAAESLTAGLFTAAVASVPGSSAVLRGGLVVYATDLKATLAGVDPERLATDGPCPRAPPWLWRSAPGRGAAPTGVSD